MLSKQPMQWTAIHRRVKHDLCLILGECLWAIKIEWQNLKNLRSVLSHLGWRTPVVVEDDVVVGGSIDCIKDHDSTMVPSTCCAWVARAVVVVHLWKAMLWWVGDDVLVIWVLCVLRVFRVLRVLRVSWWDVSEVGFVAAVVVFAVVVFAVVAVAVSLLGRVLFGVGAHRCLNDLGCRCWSCS
jgi:hypothetical protein